MGSEKKPPGRPRTQEGPYHDALQRIRSAPLREERLARLKEVAVHHEAWASHVLSQCLEDPCEQIRDFLIDELARRDDIPKDRLETGLHASSWYVKSSWLKILGKRMDPAFTETIESVIQEPNADVRRCAAEALGRIGGDDARRLLLILARDGNRFVRQSAEQALQKICDLKFS